MLRRSLPVLIVLLAVAAVLVWFHFESAMPIRESHRVSNPAGYSIIHPDDWSANIVEHSAIPGVSDAIELTPKKWQGFEPSIILNHLTGPLDSAGLVKDGYTPTKFNGFDAWIQNQRTKRFTTRRMSFTTPIGAFSLVVALPGIEGAKMESWWNFAGTFRLTGGH